MAKGAERTLKDKVAAVTGGAGHIGRKTCEYLAEKHVHLAVIDKDVDAGLKFVSSLKVDFKIEAVFFDIDLLEESAFSQVSSEIGKHYGRLDYLVNNAAFYDEIPGWGVPFQEEAYQAWMKVMQVNLLAPFFLVQQLVPLMEQSSCASVVNVSSIYGMLGPDHRLYQGTNMTNPAAYAASKGGLLQLTRWLSTVLAPKIRVNSVSPGGIERGQTEVFQQRYRERTPLGRMASEIDVAKAICFLLSSESVYISGQNIVVDGGWSVW